MNDDIKLTSSNAIDNLIIRLIHFGCTYTLYSQSHSQSLHHDDHFLMLVFLLLLGYSENVEMRIVDEPTSYSWQTNLYVNIIQE